jgi:ceramide glucosyltransferase
MSGPHLIAAFGWALAMIAFAGAFYALAASALVRWHLGAKTPGQPRTEAVTLLKPLYGDEPRLLENLSSFLALDHAGPVQVLFGAHRRDDPALAAVATLRATHPDRRIDLVVDATPHGANGKIANLINMAGHAAHPVLVISDSDIAVAPDYLTRVLAALDAPGVGAVTCAYRGRGDAGFWSRMGAAGIDWQLLPGILFGVRMRLAAPCMGSTIALSARTLAAIGGFAAFADTLADDYAIGEAVRAHGLKVAVPPMLVTHAGADAGFSEFWHHEVRWGATILGVAPGRYFANVIAMPLPLALLAIPLAPGPGALATLTALVARVVLAAAIGRAARARPLSLVWLPVRDILTFAAFVASFFVRSVAWRDSSLTIRGNGLIARGPET